MKDTIYRLSILAWPSVLMAMAITIFWAHTFA